MNKNITKKLNKINKNFKKHPKKISFRVKHHTKKIFKEHIRDLIKGAKKGHNTCEITIYSFDIENDELFNYDYYISLLNKSDLKYTIKDKKNILSPDLNDDIEITIKWGENINYE